MATRLNQKSMEFKVAALEPAFSDTDAQRASSAISTASPTTTTKALSNSQPPATGIAKGAPSAVAAVAAKGSPAPPRFTSEETILLRGLASGASSKEMAAQMRLPRESLYRLIGDLRRKTGASSDTALAVWVLRNMSSGAGERRGGAR
jgi:DNA-binding CsgD family transcriptional regulator